MHISTMLKASLFLLTWSVLTFGTVWGENESFLINPTYLSNEQIGDLFHSLTKKHPLIARTYTIGKTLQERELNAIQISEGVNTNRELLKPMIKLTANIHGDEAVGRQLLVYLVEYLVSNYDQYDIKNLLNRTDIHILPSINPDGFAKAKEGSCDSLRNYVGRHNAAGVDLNRDFPDRLEDERTIQIKAQQRQPETSAIIEWIVNNPFVISANFHGGAVVASYPYDNSVNHHDCCEESLTPDDRVFKTLARTYSDNHPIMRTGKECNETFPNGVTNGAYWYELNGGMQDFNYAFTNCFELTIELSCCKFPLAYTLPNEWHKNKRSLLNLMKLAHMGVKGLVKDINGYPINDAKVVVQGIEGKMIRTTKRGEYWRLLTPGTYNIQALAFGFIHDLIKSFPSITRIYSIGKSVQGRDLWVMEIFEKPGQHVPGIPEFKYVANMHGNEVIGREMLLYLSKYICENYLRDDRITKIVNNTRLHFLFSMNPDGYEISMEGDKTSAVGRANIHDIDLNRNFPDQYGTDYHNFKTEPEVRAVMDWTLSIPFVLSANLHGGSLVANYPFDDNANDFLDPSTKLRSSTITHQPNPTGENSLFRHLAKVYSQAHPTMHLGNPCPLFKSEVFPGGITNGAEWYSVTGGMQDWNYVRAGVLELTIELGCDKFPMASELSTFWQDNREPLLKFIEQVRCGVHGFIRSSIGNPVAGAIISLDSTRHVTYSTRSGDYWRLALPGMHNITVMADGYEPHRGEFIILNEGPCDLRLDVSLMRDDPQHWASAHDYRIIENVVHTRYHSNEEISNQMYKLKRNNADVVSFGTADNGIENNPNSLILTSEIGSPEETKFQILVISSLFDATSPMGREITLNLGRHLIEGYRIQEPNVLKLLNTSVIHIFPRTDNFDEAYRLFKANNTLCDPVIGNELAETILDPEYKKQRDSFLNYIESNRFDLVLSFSAGNSELKYPQQMIYENYARGVVKTDINYPRLKCSITSTRTAQEDQSQRITNLLYNLYHVPLFTMGISCCRMPVQTELASVWRQNIDKIMNFLHLPDSGVKGRVESEDGQSLRSAFIKIQQFEQIYNVSKNLAHFKIILTAGEYDLQISCQEYKTKSIRIIINQTQIIELGIVTLNLNRFYGFGESEVNDLYLTSPAYITGFVLDTQNHPIGNAKISTEKKDVYNFTDSDGKYSLRNIHFGNITLQVEAANHYSTSRIVDVKAKNGNLIFRLRKDNRVLGVPRLIFVLLTGFMLIIAVAVCTFAIQFIQHRSKRLKRYYDFSLLPQKAKDSFEEEDDQGETELFHSPIQKGMFLKPYYDDELDIESNTENEESEEEDIIMLKQTKKKSEYSK